MSTRLFLFLTGFSLCCGLLSGCSDADTDPPAESNDVDSTNEADENAPTAVTAEADDPNADAEHDDQKHYSVTGTTENFAKLTSSGQPVLVDYWAEWCGPCLMIGPKVEELAHKLEGKALVVKVNVDEQPDLVSEDIEGFPYFAFYKDGEKVDHVLGLPSLDLEEAAQVLEDKLMALADDKAAAE